ncbi:MAG: replicative DNA helicase [Phycisphaerales bacterium]|nr:replicative DNA helicase [Phycisphaerales bacterium]
MTARDQGNFDFDGGNGRKGRGDRPRFVAGRDLQKLFERMPPFSVEAEMSLLGSLLLDPEAAAEVIPMLPSGDAFYRETHGAIYNALISLYDRHNSGDLVQLADMLESRGILEELGGAEYLLELAECVPSAANAIHYARIVRRKSQLRHLIDAAGQILHDAYHADDGEDATKKLLDKAESLIFGVAEQAETVEAESLDALLQQIMDALENNEGHSITGVASGYYDLDDLTSGFQPGEMTILAARPSMGKTALALNLVEQLAFAGSPHHPQGPRTPVAFFSLEMSRQSVTSRLLSAHSGVDSQKLRTNRLSRDEFNRLFTSCSTLSEASIHIDDTPGLTVMQLRAKARRMVAQHGVRCIVIDYLQLMSDPTAASRDGRQQEVSSISRGIKALARELRLPIICLAQLNRSTEQRPSHKPRMADLRESGSIEQDADVIMLLHREEYYHTEDPEWIELNPDKVGLAEVIVAKQRNGPTGIVNLTWNSRITRFLNFTSRRDPVYDAAPPSVAVYGPAPAPGHTERKPFTPGQKAGPVDDFRDGSGDSDWVDEDIGDIPV